MNHMYIRRYYSFFELADPLLKDGGVCDFASELWRLGSGSSEIQ